MPRLFKRKQSYNVAKNSFVAKIYLLDHTTVDFNLLPEVTGRDCLEKVAQCLDIQEVRRVVINVVVIILNRKATLNTHFTRGGGWPGVGGGRSGG